MIFNNPATGGYGGPGAPVDPRRQQYMRPPGAPPQMQSLGSSGGAGFSYGGFGAVPGMNGAAAPGQMQLPGYSGPGLQLGGGLHSTLIGANPQQRLMSAVPGGGSASPFDGGGQGANAIQRPMGWAPTGDAGDGGAGRSIFPGGWINRSNGFASSNVPGHGAPPGVPGGAGGMMGAGGAYGGPGASGYGAPGGMGAGSGYGGLGVPGSSHQGGNDPGSILTNLLNQANQANTDRYNQALGLAGSWENSALQREQIQRDNELGRTSQYAVGRGLGNSTVVDSLRRGVMDDSALRQQEIGDRANQNRLNIISSRTDQQPNLGLYAQLLSRPGALMGGGYGFGSASRGAKRGPGITGPDQNGVGSKFGGRMISPDGGLAGSLPQAQGQAVGDQSTGLDSALGEYASAAGRNSPNDPNWNQNYNRMHPAPLSNNGLAGGVDFTPPSQGNPLLDPLLARLMGLA